MDYFTIYVYGSLSWMREMMMGIASIFDYSGSMPIGFGNLSMSRFVAICALIGLIVQVMRSIQSGKGALDGFTKQLVLYFIFLLMFGVSAGARLVDAKNTDRMVTVDGLPLGLILPASLLTTFSNTMANEFVTAMPSAYSIETGDYDAYREASFLSSLQTLMAIRDVGVTEQLMERLTASYGGQPIEFPSKTLEVYVTRCTMTGVSLGHKSIEDVVYGMMPEALRFDSEVFKVEIIEGTIVSCTEAWNYVGADNGTSVFASLRTTNDPTYRMLLSLAARITSTENIIDPDTSLIGDLVDGWNAIVASMGAGNAETEFEAMGRTFREMGIVGRDPALGLTASDAINQSQRAVFASIMEPIFYQAQAGHFTNSGDPAAAMMIQEAVKERNTRWAAAGSLFMNIVVPLSAVFESFIWIIVPFVAGAILLGFGLSLLGKVAMAMLSVALWTPLLIVIDRFTRNGVAEAVRADPEVVQYGMTSFYTVNAVGATAENWIATGGMLASSTPLLAMALLTGSSMAMVGVANRMSTADQDLDVGKLSPQVADAPPALRMNSAYEHNSQMGFRGQGAETTTSSFNLGDRMSEIVSNDQMLVQGRGAELGRTLAQANTANYSVGRTQALTSAAEEAVQSSNSQTLTSRYDDSLALAQNYTDDKQLQQMFAAKDSMVLSGQIPASAAAANMKATGEFSDSEIQSMSERFEQAERQSATLSDEEKATFQTSFADRIMATDAETLTQGLEGREMDSVSNAYKETEQALTRYQSSTAMARELGTGRTYNALQVAQRMTGNDDQADVGRRQLQNAWYRGLDAMPEQQRQSTEAAYEQLKAYHENGPNNLTPHAASNLARLEMMSEGQAGFDESARRAAVMAVGSLYAFGSNAPGTVQQPPEGGSSLFDRVPSLDPSRAPEPVDGPVRHDLAPQSDTREDVMERVSSGVSGRNDRPVYAHNDQAVGGMRSTPEEMLPHLQQLVGESESQTVAMATASLFGMGKNNRALGVPEGFSGQVPATYHNGLERGLTNGQALYLAATAARNEELQSQAREIMADEFGGGIVGAKVAQNMGQLMENKYRPGTDGMTAVATPLRTMNARMGNNGGATEQQYTNAMRSLTGLTTYHAQSYLAGNEEMRTEQAVMTSGSVHNTDVAREIARVNEEIMHAEQSGNTLFDREIAEEYISGLVSIDRTASTAGGSSPNYDFESQRPDFTSPNRGQMNATMTAVRAMSRGSYEAGRDYTPDTPADIYKIAMEQDMWDANVARSTDPLWSNRTLPEGYRGSDQTSALIASGNQMVMEQGLSVSQTANMSRFLDDANWKLESGSLSSRALEMDAWAPIAQEEREQVLSTAQDNPQLALRMFQQKYMR